MASFVPPPPHALPDLLGELERYFHSEDTTPLLIKLGLIHAHFETLHPFLDGNGRIHAGCSHEMVMRLSGENIDVGPHDPNADDTEWVIEEDVSR